MSNDLHPSTVVPRDRLLPALLGLRGFAAVAVVLFHIVHIANVEPPAIFSFINTEFAYSVQLFFILSAFSLMHSTESMLARPTWCVEYLTKRFFRIVPLFYFVVGIMTVRELASVRPFDIGQLLLNLTLAFGFAPWEGLVWGGWAVGIEVQFYVILPVVLLVVKNLKIASLLLVFSFFVSFEARSSLNSHFALTNSEYGYNWGYFSFATNIFYFSLGIYSYLLWKNTGQTELKIKIILIVSTLVFLLGLIVTGYMIGWKVDPMLLGFGFSALIVWQAIWPSKLLENNVAMYLGERSYSIYLLHALFVYSFKDEIHSIYEAMIPYLGASAYFISIIPIFALILCFAEITYRIVEVPGIGYGKRVVSGWRNRHVNSIDI